MSDNRNETLQLQTGNHDLEYGTILSEFRCQVEQWRNKPAVVFENETRSVTYLELQNQSRSFAHHLKSEKNSIIALLLPSGFEHILSVLAVLEASKTYCPLSLDYPAVKLTLMLQELENPLLITTSTILNSVGLDYGNTYLLDSPNHENLEPEPPTAPHEIPTESETAAVYFTSGSTGGPKAALLGNRALVGFAKTGAVAFNITSTDESVCVLNPGFILNIYDVLVILLSGGTIHVAPNDLRYDIPKLREWVKAVGTVTFIMMVSSSGESFYRTEPEAFPACFRAMAVAGEKLQSGPPSDAPFKVYSVYGSTESTGITWTEVAPISPLPSPVTQTLAGVPFPGVEVYILDEERLTPLPVGETGEIAVASLCLFQGYLNRSEETAKKFLILGNGVRVCRTGDLGYLQEDGNLVLLNRRDNQVKVGGYRFDLSDLEAALLQHPSVEKAVAVLEKLDTLKFHLFYQLKPNALATPATELMIQDFLQDRLPHYAFPHSITEVEEFPRNAHGKVNKEALFLKRSTQHKALELPQTSIEKLLAVIWSALLGIPTQNISRTDNFFSLGGSSNNAAAVILKLKEINPEFQVKPFNIFKIPVLKNLAEFLDNNRRGSLMDARDFEADVNSFALDFIKSENILESAEANVILITGSTGYLGNALLLRLLKSTAADIYCLIRASSPEEARGRLEKSFHNLKIALDPKYTPRIHFIPGNISKPYFGLTESKFNALAQLVDQVYHCAAEVHWLKRYEELRESNVLGTLEILKFVAMKKPKLLHYVSSVSVLGIMGNSNSTANFESRNIVKEACFETGYTQSKWVAEKLVWRAIDAGVSAIVYRPGIIGSDSNLHVFNTNNFITLLFQACESVEAFPDFPWVFPYGSLDFTADSIIEIAQNPKSATSKVFHTFQNVLCFEDFYESFEKMGMKKVSVVEWENLIMTTDNQSSGSGPVEMMKLFFSIPYYKDLTIFQFPFLKSERVNISNAETMKALLSRFPIPSKEDQIQNFMDSVYCK